MIVVALATGVVIDPPSVIASVTGAVSAIVVLEIAGESAIALASLIVVAQESATAPVPDLSATVQEATALVIAV